MTSCLTLPVIIYRLMCLVSCCVIHSSGNIELLWCGSGLECYSRDERPVMCRDPLNSNGWYLGASNSIWYFDESKKQVTLFTRGDPSLPPDEDDSYFNLTSGLLVTSDGKTIWCCDASNYGLRSIDVASGRHRPCPYSGFYTGTASYHVTTTSFHGSIQFWVFCFFFI